jgi:hypothetical protein
MWCYFLDDSRGILLGDYQRANSISVNFEKGTSYSLRLYWAASPDIYTGNNVVEANKWQLVTLVRDKENSKVYFYVNDILKYTYNGALTDKVTSSLHLIGRDNRTGTTTVNGRIDEPRIYAIALSEDDIKELYQTRASLDNKGNLSTHAINETKLNKGNKINESKEIKQSNLTFINFEDLKTELLNSKQ